MVQHYRKGKCKLCWSLLPVTLKGTAEYVTRLFDIACPGVSAGCVQYTGEGTANPKGKRKDLPNEFICLRCLIWHSIVGCRVVYAVGGIKGWSALLKSPTGTKSGTPPQGVSPVFRGSPVPQSPEMTAVFAAMPNKEAPLCYDCSNSNRLCPSINFDDASSLHWMKRHPTKPRSWIEDHEHCPIMGSFCSHQQETFGKEIRRSECDCSQCQVGRLCFQGIDHTGADGINRSWRWRLSDVWIEAPCEPCQRVSCAAFLMIAVLWLQMRIEIIQALIEEAEETRWRVGGPARIAVCGDGGLIDMTKIKTFIVGLAKCRHVVSSYAPCLAHAGAGEEVRVCTHGA